jgi:hypothetical protein
VVLGRIVVLEVSSGCLNIGRCSFHLVAAKKTRVVGWCKGEPLFSVMQVGACVPGSWCFHLVGAGTLRNLVLPSIGFWMLHIIFVSPMTINDVKLSVAFIGVSSLIPEERREKNFS